MNSNLEKYLKGEPINEELAALKEGRLPETEPFRLPGHDQVGNQSTGAQNAPISRADRVNLKEMLMHPGWPVLHRLLEKATLRQQESATLLSQNNPLANAQPIAEAWAYVAIYKRAHEDLDLLVEMEIKALDEEHPEK
jgi:hypothetical protein